MSQLSHGMLLLDQGRLEDAEACFLNELRRDPDNDFLHSRIAVCRMQQKGRKSDALQSVDEAIRLSPDEDYYHGLRSLILTDLHRPREALDAADRAISMNPDTPFNFSAKASAYCELHRWAEAEENCRLALTIDPDDSMASHLLTSVLRLQGKAEENEAAVEQQLSENPESSFAHTNAGWAALHRNDHGKAEEHFTEALRLDPDMEAAREGLLESFKARSWFYRVYLSYCFFMQRFTGRAQWGIVVGALLVYHVLKEALRQIGKLPMFIMIGLWLTLILWIWLAPGIGNFLICLDRKARHALRRNEAIHGLWTGFSLLFGIPLLAVGILAGITPLTPLGAMLLSSTIPATLTFTNQSKKGRITFGSVIALILVCGTTASLIQFSIPGQTNNLAELLFLVAVLAGALSTWLGNIPALRRDDSG